MTRQAAIRSGFDRTTTARQALGGRDLRGKTAIVTGGYAGLGLETTRVLAEAGAKVIVPARTPDKARRALDGIPNVELVAMNLADPASVDAFARTFVDDSGRALHMLINNAGIMATPLMRDDRGYEGQFATNHLGHFQLTARLWPALVKARGARVVSLSSRAHRICGVDFEDPNFERREYQKWAAYGQSKSANILFAVELDRRGEAHGVRAFSVHPGTILTDLARDLSEEELAALGVRAGKVTPEQIGKFKTIEQGAATTVWCSTSAQLDGMGGVYCEDVDIAEVVQADPPLDAGEPGVVPWAIEPELAKRLWGLSEELCKTSFTI
ncbi:MAG: oxidoreductase [Labilithrix sp.]|nr:oxidoreductase [Labilithrix sp.]